jgi:hypothetical protein
MNLKTLPSLTAIAAALFLGGCNTAPDYPVTYQIPIGYSPQITSAYGVQNLNICATHDLSVKPGVPIYFQVVSPVNMTVYVFDKTGSGPGGVLLRQLQGSSNISSATSTSGTLELVFSSEPYKGGTVQLTVSDRPLGPMTTTTVSSSTQGTTMVTIAPASAVEPAPGSSTTTTVTTSTAPAPSGN